VDRLALVVSAVLTAHVWPPSFTEGQAPLHIDGDIPTAASCGECHPREHAQWSSSRHRVSATNALYVDGVKAEPHVRCVNCHAPLRARADEGISCAVCHVRDGAVLVASDAKPYGHPVRRDDALKDPVFCARCHEFRSHVVVDGQTTLLEEKMQSTYTEWRRYRDADGRETCQTCHMPNGSHAFRGADDVDLLKRSLAARVVGGALVLSSTGVGHAFPTGDVFRHLTIEARTSTGVVEVARVASRPREGELGPLVPGEERVLELPRGAVEVVVAYHAADDGAERRGRVSYDELVMELARLPVSPRGAAR
jgi:hypothetical protein